MDRQWRTHRERRYHCTSNDGHFVRLGSDVRADHHMQPHPVDRQADKKREDQTNRQTDIGRQRETERDGNCSGLR